jgi:hypothetical protein
VRGPKIIARTLSVPSRPDQYGNVWQYHPRSDRHSKVACWAVLFDLLQSSGLLREHVTSGKVTFGINRTLNDWATGKKKNLDLVVARTPGPAGDAVSKAFDLKELAEDYGLVLSYEEREILAQLPVAAGGRAGATVLIALEAKACMTEHVKARPRLHDELDSSHSTIHGDNPNALAVGFVMINNARTFISPDRNRYELSAGHPPTVSLHTQPHATEQVFQKIREIRRRPGPGSNREGFDAIGVVVIDAANDGSAITVVTEPPAPSPTSEYNYAQMIGRAGHLYDSNFGNV